MKIVVVNDTDGRENIGCRLTSGMFKQAVSRAAPDAEMVSAPWLFTPVLPVDGWRWRAKLALSPLSETTLRELAVAEYGLGAVNATEDADAVIFHAEGTLSDRDSALRILRVLSLPLLAALHGNAPVSVANGTIPAYTDRRRAIVATLLAAADHAAMRDELSATFWRTAFCPDAAVLWNGRTPAPHSDMVLVTTTAAASRDSDLRLATSALAVCRRWKLKPLVMTKNASRLSPLREQIDAAGGVVHDSWTTLDAADEWMSRCRIHIGGRYHMALMAATKGIPSIVVQSNNPKNAWLASAVSGVDFVADAGEVAATAEDMLRRPFPDATTIEQISRMRGACAAGVEEMVQALRRPKLADRVVPPLGGALSLRLAFEAQRARARAFRHAFRQRET